MKLEEQQIIETDLSDLLPTVTARKNDGCRLMAITATTNGNRYELCYSFDKHYQVRTHRVTILKRDMLPSITGIYPSAFVYENELCDNFGIAIAGSRAASRDGRPCKRFTFPVELTISNGEPLCQTR